MSRLWIIVNPLQFIQGLFIWGYLYGSAINVLSSLFLDSRDMTVSCNLRVNTAIIISVCLDSFAIWTVAIILSYCCIHITSGHDWASCPIKMYLIYLLDFDTVLK